VADKQKRLEKIRQAKAELEAEAKAAGAKGEQQAGDGAEAGVERQAAAHHLDRHNSPRRHFGSMANSPDIATEGELAISGEKLPSISRTFRLDAGFVCRIGPHDTCSPAGSQRATALSYSPDAATRRNSRRRLLDSASARGVCKHGLADLQDAHLGGVHDAKGGQR
jgi:hypothetical protein